MKFKSSNQNKKKKGGTNDTGGSTGSSSTGGSGSGSRSTGASSSRMMTTGAASPVTVTPSTPPHASSSSSSDAAVSLDPLTASAAQQQQQQRDVWRQANEWKLQGNAAFGVQDYATAIDVYTRGIDWIEQNQITTNSNSNTTPTAIPEDILDLWINLLSNRAQVHLKTLEYQQAQVDCQQALKVHQTHHDTVSAATTTTTTNRALSSSQSSSSSLFKVWFRRALARVELAEQRLLDPSLNAPPPDNDDGTDANTSNASILAAQLAQSHIVGAKHDLQQCLASVEQPTHVNDDVNNNDSDKSSSFAVSSKCARPTLAVAVVDSMKLQVAKVAGRLQTLKAKLDALVMLSPKLLVSTHHGVTAAVTLPPLLPPRDQQRADILRLLHHRATSSPVQASEAFFIVDWDWWCDWCHYVQFFTGTNEICNEVVVVVAKQHPFANAVGPTDKAATVEMKPPQSDTGSTDDQIMEDETEVEDTMTEMNVSDDDNDDDDDEESDAVQRLRLLPLGAVLPDLLDDDDDTSPGPIDNSQILLPHPKDSSPNIAFARHWYAEYYQTALDSASAPTETATTEGTNASTAAMGHSVSTAISKAPLRPGLVRGHHYEVLPREVYFALRLWYTEVSPPICRRAVPISDGRGNDWRIVLYPVDHDGDGGSIKPSGPTEFCDACGAPFALKRCTQCLSVFYCDRICQENVWKTHKVECRKSGSSRLTPSTGSASTRSNGRMGLNNLGNTCFMNSALQCLSHATPLTRHFLSGKFKADINDSNPLGTGGKLAHSYEDVMKALHRGNARSYSPTLLKRKIAMFAPRFAGCLQHDAQEFLAYLLDGLHEDLNRIRKAPYVEMPDVTDGQCIAVAGARAWDAHKRRNDSLVMDTFYGQFKSTCVCPKCSRVSVSFDAFNHVSLEIPQENNAIITLEVIVFGAASGSAAPQPTRYAVQTRRSSRTRDFKASLSGMCGIPAANLELCEYNKHDIRYVCNDGKSVEAYAASQLVAYEVQATSNAEMPGLCHAVLSHRFVEMLQQNQQPSDPFGLPMMTSFLTTLSCREVWDFIWALVVRMVSTDDDFDPKSLMQLRVVTASGKPKPIFPILDESVDPEPEATGKMGSILPRDNDEPLVSFFGAEHFKKQFLFIHVEWMDQRDDGSCEEPDFKRIDEKRFISVSNHESYLEAANKKREKSMKKGVTLDQCFETFTKPERLDEHNMWYCSSCKEHVQAMKTMELWKLPNLLIVHLKRFEFKHALRRDKLDTLVDFPLEDLDLNVHCASPSTSSFVDDNVPGIYDCFAVVNHFGRMGFGHYTAYARSWDETGLSKEWDLFDDSNVRSVGDGKGGVVSPAAYVLLYRRRTFT